MSYSTHTVASAIATIAERAAQEEGVAAVDTDAMGRLMANAEEMVANQLARAGMLLHEAKQLASDASMMPGRDGPEATKLADEAYRNQHAGPPPAAPEAVSEPETAEASEPSVADTQHQASIPGAPAQVMAPAAAPLQVFAPARVEAQPLMAFTMLQKKVHEVFRGIDANDAVFDFEVPVVNWSGNHPEIPEYDAAYAFDPEALHTVLYAIAEKASLNIVGPHGCGKTQIVHQVAARLNFPVTTLPMDGQLSRRELIGKETLRATPYGTESHFAQGLLPRALMEPGFILFDEIDRGVSDLQYACHSVYLQHGLKLLEDGGRFIKFHEMNRVFGTANTKGRGSLDGMYQPPEEMSEATRDRWSLWLDMDYPDVESDTTVLINKTPGILAEHAEIIATIASQIRAAYKEGRLSQTCSMRQQLEVARKTVFMCRKERDDVRRRKALKFAFDRVIGGRASPEDKGSIDNLVQIKMPDAFTGAPII